MKYPIIAVDFDGTIVEHQFPDIGKEVPGAIAWLKQFQGMGARLILWTMRSDERGDGTNPLSEAVEFCKSRGIEFWAVNTNPEQTSWTDSPKAYAHVYIDDAACGCPLRESFTTDRPMVDWSVVGPDVANRIAPRRLPTGQFDNAIAT
jgi:hypothetical protein